MPRLAGVGTGIIRAMEEKPEVTFENLDSAHEYVTIIKSVVDLLIC